MTLHGVYLSLKILIGGLELGELRLLLIDGRLRDPVFAGRTAEENEANDDDDSQNDGNDGGREEGSWIDRFDTPGLGVVLLTHGSAPLLARLADVAIPAVLVGLGDVALTCTRTRMGIARLPASRVTLPATTLVATIICNVTHAVALP